MRILLVGLTARALAESAVRAGCDILSVDYFGDLDTRRLGPNASLRERGTEYSAAALARVAREFSYDAVAYGGGLENHPEAVEALAERDLVEGAARPGYTVPDPFLRAWLSGRVLTPPAPVSFG